MRRILWLLILLALLGVGLGFWWVEHRRPAKTGAIPLGQPGMTMWGTSLVGREDGKTAWEIRAKTIWLSKDNRVAVIRDIQEARFEVEDERVTLKAPWARLDRNLMKLTARGGIYGKLNDGEFWTEGVYVDLLKEKLYSTGFVRFHSEDADITAERLEADLKKETVTLKGNVFLKEGDKVLRGRELLYFLEDKQYELVGETEVELEL